MFDMIAAVEEGSDSLNNNHTSYSTKEPKPTNTPALTTSQISKKQNGTVNSKLDDALQILEEMDELDDEQKDVFERELLWQYCDKRAENANRFAQLQKTLKTVLDNDN